MRLLILFILLSTALCIVVKAQTPVQRLESVPKEFVERYRQEYHEYNPLHVGDLWQFIDYLGGYDNREIVKDTIVNGKKYFKKLEFQYPIIPDYFYWERNDTTKMASYRLDIEDLDLDGDSLDEVLLDSLEVPHATTYFSFRYTWRVGEPDPKLVLIQGPYWVVVYGDTVMARIASFLFQDDLIADKYGVVEIYPEGSPPVLLTGMIINGVKYGNIVDVDDFNESVPSEYILENNYPNPFNPSTLIIFYLPEATFVKLTVFDVLGNEVKMLINEEKKSGFHKAIFNGNGLPSGVYFYNLQTTKYSETKKMILIR